VVVVVRVFLAWGTAKARHLDYVYASTLISSFSCRIENKILKVVKPHIEICFDDEAQPVFFFLFTLP
jgi:hypothetical protein